MPAELLIRTADTNGLVKGSIVSVRPANWAWGSAEALPNFIRVTVTDATFKQVEQYARRLQRNPVLNVDSSDLVTDIHRCTITTDTPGPANGITQSDVQQFLTEWDLDYVSHTTQAVTFDIDIERAAKSLGFWRRDLTGIVFNQTNYDQGTGEHTLTADYSATAFNPNNVAQAVMARNADVVTNTGGVITFVVERVDVRQRFLRDMQDVFGDVSLKRQWRITPAAVDTVIGNGGTGTYTAAQLQSVLVDLNG